MDIQNNNFSAIEQALCWACKTEISCEDNFCRKCGKGQGKLVSWQYTHWGAVVLIFIIGPFSLYYIWRSPVISHNAKWIYTAIISIITWYAVMAVFKIYEFVQILMGPALI